MKENNPLQKSKMTQEEIEQMEALGYQLNVLRHKKKMSIEELSAKCNIKPNNLRNIENGSFYLKVSTLNRILNVLGYDIFFVEKKQ